MHFTPDLNLVEEHRRWLNGFDDQYRRNWEKLLNADPEAAACEAEVRRVLEGQGNAVEPNEILDGSGQAPDFRCTQRGQMFYVEVTSISIEKATEFTELPHMPEGNGGASNYGQLNGAIFNAAKQKTPQCSQLQHPALVAVGTFHFQASCICFHRGHLQMLLTGQELITSKLDTRTGKPVGGLYLSTQLRSAAFLRPDSGIGMDHARNPISGILLCGLGCNPPEIRGVLHPSPVHHFDRTLLPSIEFCRLRTGYETGALSTEWV